MTLLSLGSSDKYGGTKYGINPFPATIPIDNCVLSARLDLNTGGGQRGRGKGVPPILEARGSQYHLPPPTHTHFIAAGSRLGPSTFNTFRHPWMIDRRITDASMGPEIFGTGRTSGNMGPEIFGTGSERVPYLRNFMKQ